MRKSHLIYIVPLLCALLLGCVKEQEFDNNPRGNFEALWKIMDEHYCFFEEKGVDWNAIRAMYAQRVDNGMTDSQLLEVLGGMLAELKDGHVNLFTSFDMGRYWGFHENYPANYASEIVDNYLKTDYRVANGFRYRVLDDNVGYITCSSFANPIGDGTLDQILTYLAPCNGLIIDVRQNGGGMVTSAEKLAARFTNEEIRVGYMRHKTGKGHRDFSPLIEQRLKPAKGVRWQKRVVVITNRRVYSAANEFVKYMRCCPNVMVVGDMTGGGAGLPFSSELPNGWIVRFSACPMYDKDKRSVENGMAPDVKVSLSANDVARGRDTLIETARERLRKGWQAAALVPMK